MINAAAEVPVISLFMIVSLLVGLPDASGGVLPGFAWLPASANPGRSVESRNSRKVAAEQKPFGVAHVIAATSLV
jgi:hypothetical protein